MPAGRAGGVARGDPGAPGKSCPCPPPPRDGAAPVREAAPSGTLRRRQVTQDPARTRVRAVLHGPDLGVRHLAQVRALGQVPPHQAVGVLVQAPFPGVVGAGEQEVRAQRRRHPRVVRELLSVVGGDRVHRAAVRPRKAGHGGPDRRRRLPADAPQERVSQRPVHQRHHGPAGARAVDSCPPPGRRSAPSPPPAPGARGCPPGPGCGPGPRGPRPAWAPPLRFGLPDRRRRCRQSWPPALRSAWTCRHVHWRPATGWPSRRSRPETRAGLQPRASRPSTSATGSGVILLGTDGAAPRTSAAPGRAAGPGLRRCAGSRAGPMTDCAPAGGRSPRRRSRFPSARGSGISRYGSGGAGPRAWRSPRLNTGTVAAIRPIRSIMRRYDHHSPTSGVALHCGTGVS